MPLTIKPQYPGGPLMLDYPPLIRLRALEATDEAAARREAREIVIDTLQREIIRLLKEDWK